MRDDFKPHDGKWRHRPKQPKVVPKLDTLATGNSAAEKVTVVDETFEVPDEPADSKQTAKPVKKWWHIFSFRHTHLSNRKWAALMAGLILVVALSGFGALKLYQHVRKLPPNKAVAVKKKVEVKPTTEPSRLTGLPVEPGLNLRPVTGVMIENSPDARPQSGLLAAGIVFEAIAEGGITRFLALYQEAQPTYIGPIRSARPYYLDWVQMFDASLAHVGGSPDALASIQNRGIKDLDQFYNAGSYLRVNTRYAPHNVYTGMTDLDALNHAKGYLGSKFASWARKKDQPAAAAKITARSIDFNVSGFLYSPHYDYNPPTNSYNRSEAGQPHTDERSGIQLSPHVVVALVLDYSLAEDGLHSIYTTTGAGHMYVFQDGTVTQGTWLRTDNKSPYTFTADGSNAPITFNAGQTWVTLVTKPDDVSYKP